MVTKRNDAVINSFNPVQLQAWRANVDMQYCISRHKVIEYCAKYATKCEPRSQSLKEVYNSVVKGLKNEDKSLKAVQKLLIGTVGDQDYSAQETETTAQETCHLLLQLPIYSASRDFVYLSLDGSRVVEHRGRTTCHCCWITTGQGLLEHMTLLHFVQKHKLPKELGGQPTPRTRLLLSLCVLTAPQILMDPSMSNTAARSSCSTSLSGNNKLFWDPSIHMLRHMPTSCSQAIYLLLLKMMSIAWSSSPGSPVIV